MFVRLNYGANDSSWGHLGGFKPGATSAQKPKHQWSIWGAVQSGVTGPGSQTQYLSLTGVIPASSRRSPEGSAKLIGEAPVRTENWHTCPAGAVHRNVTGCC